MWLLSKSQSLPAGYGPFGRISPPFSISAGKSSGRDVRDLRSQRTESSMMPGKRMEVGGAVQPGARTHSTSRGKLCAIRDGGRRVRDLL